jgi:riboflavin synthase alpha subunit
MFTGIIRIMATIHSIDVSSGAFSVTLDKELSLTTGDSIAVNGVCLTVETRESARITATLMPATFRATALGSLHIGDRVNIEEPVRVGEKLDGHMVLGHVDGIGEITDVTQEGTSRLVKIHVGDDLAKYIAPKGSVAVDGVSLTVVSLSGNEFLVSLTPYTQEHTRFHALKKDDIVNIEADVLARYAARLQSFY